MRQRIAIPLSFESQKHRSDQIVEARIGDNHLADRFGLANETVPDAESRQHAPARRFTVDRLALIGDAAHAIHPIAGQGLNLGFKDAAALAEVVAIALRAGRDPGTADVLDEYQRWRGFDTLRMAAMTDGLNRLFSNDVGPLRLIRDLGLGLVDRLPPIKRVFADAAAGAPGPSPRLVAGEPI